MSGGANHGQRTTTDDFLNVVATRAGEEGIYRKVIRVVRVVRTPAIPLDGPFTAARSKPSRPRMIDRAAPRANARALGRQAAAPLRQGLKKRRSTS